MKFAQSVIEVERSHHHQLDQQESRLSSQGDDTAAAVDHESCDPHQGQEPAKQAFRVASLAELQVTRPRDPANPAASAGEKSRGRTGFEFREP